MRREAFEALLEHSFQNPALLRQALTHSSYANEMVGAPKKHADNERLEFLGDAVLELVTSEFLYAEYPQLPEGKLSKLRASLVCETSLAASARELALGEQLLLGKGETATGGKDRDSILSDAMEAMIGALYLDGGYEVAKAFVLRRILTDVSQKLLFSDSKTVLQELTQKQFQCVPTYEVVKEEGPAHNKTFGVRVSVNKEVLASGEGSSKKAAEQMAAYEAIGKLRMGKDTDVFEKH